ncbi:dynein regulatory complex protein 1-like isoform X1 [Diorhabda carinulata]|uniref:dynein regulatory complex protein 1-like isoform X1 n=1 Tax=Diorhabda carinulata TaxID=1163345 RepID=UPI0025A039B5|nr:dynein regulatory complex protein 1-like isoform X1 [Diorhabda carinulata]
MLILFHCTCLIANKLFEKINKHFEIKKREQFIKEIRERKFKFSPAAFRQRYLEVYYILTDERWRCKISTLCDFGCGEMGFYHQMRSFPLTSFSLIDIDEETLRKYASHLVPCPYENIDRIRHDPFVVSVYVGSVADPSYRFKSVHVITSIELVEHLYPDCLEAFPYTIFGFYTPLIVIVTTPNADFNVLFFDHPEILRHYDHKFEWTREQFEDWSNNIVTRFPDYTVFFSGAGNGPSGTEFLGKCTQIGIFVRRDVLEGDYTIEANRNRCDSSHIHSSTCKCTCTACNIYSFGICTYYSKSTIPPIYNNNNKEHFKQIFEKPFPYTQDFRPLEEKMFVEFRQKLLSISKLHYNERRNKCIVPVYNIKSGYYGDSVREEDIVRILKKNGYEIEESIEYTEYYVVLDPMEESEDSSSDVWEEEEQQKFPFWYEHHGSGFIDVNRDQVISEEKRKFIEKSNEKWEDLYRKRNQEESALTEYKLQKQEEISSKIRHLNVCHEEQFRKTKIELERDIEKAQNEFERIKSLALFNRERLEYNYEVLKRRENENLIIKSQQKRRMSKLQDTISDLKTTLSDYRKTTTKKIKKTKSDIEKLRKNIVDIDDKADQFANSSEKKFKDLWKLNARDCYNLLDKIIKIDRILHEQQLGVRWTRPVYQKIDFPSIGDRQSVSSVGPKQKSSLLLKKSKSDTRSTSALNLSKSYHTESDTYKKLLKRVLKALDKKSGFLTEKCIKLLINTYEDDEQSLVTLDNVFLSLGIKKSQDIDVMADFFLPYCYCRVCAEHYSSHSSFASTAIASRHMSQVSYMSKTSFQRSNYFSPSIIEVEYTLEGIQQSDDLISHIVKEVIEKESLVDEHGLLKIDTPDEDSEDDEQCYTHPKERLSGRRRTLKVDIEKISCKYNHPLVISTVYVLAALKEFVIKYHKQQQTTQIGPTMEERLSKRRCTASRSLEDEDIKRHWINLRRTFRKSHMLIWDGLREGLTKYLEILKDRKNVSEDVMKLRKTNEALKRLLADYIDHRVLMKPICPQKSSELLRKCSQTTQIKI